MSLHRKWFLIFDAANFYKLGNKHQKSYFNQRSDQPPRTGVMDFEEASYTNLKNLALITLIHN